MSIFGGGPCKQMVKFDGTSLDLTGLNVPALTAGLGPLSFALGHLQIKHELIQAAAEISQLLDAAQFANCTKINMIPKDSPERIKIINQAMENEIQLKFSLVMKLVAANPTSEVIQKALADWIASQSIHIQELSSQAKGVPVTRGGEPEVPLPSLQKVESSIESAKEAEPYLGDAMQRGAILDLNSVIDSV